MIENSYVEIASDGKRVTVNYFEDDKVLEGPAILPARYASFAAMCQYIETQFNHHRLNTHQLSKLQGLMGSPWPHTHFRIYWKDANGGTVNEVGNYPSGSARDTALRCENHEAHENLDENGLCAICLAYEAGRKSRVARDAEIAQLHEDARRVADAVNLELDDLRTKWNAAERKLSGARRAAIEECATLADSFSGCSMLAQEIRKLASPENQFTCTACHKTFASTPEDAEIGHLCIAADRGLTQREAIEEIKRSPAVASPDKEQI